MRKKYLLLSTIMLLGTCLRAQVYDPSPVRFVNVGRMAVASNGSSTSLYIPYSVWMSDPDSKNSTTSILQEGITTIGGSFYQDSKSHVFKVDTDGWGVSTGAIVFSGNHAPKKSGHIYGERVVRSLKASDMDGFDRSSQYVAFPHIRIASNDTIRIPGRMGIDASSISYRLGNEKGIVYLHSDVNDAKTKVYDASLRISAVGISNANDRKSESLVAEGSVVIEKDVSIYRTATGLIFPFAAPFTNLRSGYFAGNFVRRLIEDDSCAGHITYVLGNKDDDKNGVIDREQYIVSALEKFVPGKGYLVKPRTSGFTYGDLHFMLTEADESVYDKGTFIFDGNLYNLSYQSKQLFAEDKLYDLSLSGQTYNKTINIVIGNSYTSALSIDRIYEELKATGLNFSSTIYYYSPGLASYQPYSFASSAVNAVDLSDIPATTSLMLRLSKGKSQTGTFTIGRSMQTHGQMSSNMRPASRRFDNELLIELSPEENPNVKDMLVVALRAKATGSISKVLNQDKDMFQLYAGDKMSVLIDSINTKFVPLGFRASSETSSYTLTVSRTESMTTEALWLEDRQIGKWINLYEDKEYTFEAQAGDSEDRFYLHFVDKSLTGIDDIEYSPLIVYYADGEIHIRRLLSADINAPIRISDMQGRTIIQKNVGSYPEEIISTNLMPGVYLIHIGGERNQTVKIIVK